MFTLVISYLTISNSPWFMDLIIQVFMEYHSLQLWILLSSPDTSTTEHPFCFGLASSFFQELFLCYFPVAYWTPTDLGGWFFQCHIFLFFHIVHEVPKARIPKWFAIPFSRGPHSVNRVIQIYFENNPNLKTNFLLIMYYILYLTCF